MAQQPMQVNAVLEQLRAAVSQNPERIAARRGVPVSSVLGVATAAVRQLARELGEDDNLARQLWHSGYHEAQLLAILIAPIQQYSDSQLHAWALELDSWDVCDQFAKRVAAAAIGIRALMPAWIAEEKLYMRRAGLALMANHCMKSCDIADDDIDAYCALIEAASVDDRPHVRQACCWALRELGKIHDRAHDGAISLALELIESANPDSVWVGRCAYKELETLIKIPERRRLISRNSKTAQKYV